MRMDIEGAEYAVMRRLLVTGQACRLASLVFEAHATTHLLKPELMDEIDDMLDDAIKVCACHARACTPCVHAHVHPTDPCMLDDAI